MDDVHKTTEEKNTGSVAVACFAGGAAGMLVLFVLGLSWVALIGFPLGALVAYAAVDIPGFIAGCKKAAKAAIPTAIEIGAILQVGIGKMIKNAVMFVLTIYQRPFVAMGIGVFCLMHFTNAFVKMGVIKAEAADLVIVSPVFAGGFAVACIMLLSISGLLASVACIGWEKNFKDAELRKWLSLNHSFDAPFFFGKQSWLTTLRYFGLGLISPFVAVGRIAYYIALGVEYLIRGVIPFITHVVIFTYTSERMVCLTHTPLGMVITTTVLVSIYGANFADAGRFVALAWIMVGGLLSMTIGLIGYKHVMPRIQTLAKAHQANSPTPE